MQGIFRKTFILALLSSVVFHPQPASQFSFKLICSGDKRTLSGSLRKWGWFQGHNLSPNVLVKNQNLKKLKQDFVDEEALITTTLTSSCHWKTVEPFYLRKTWNRIFNTNSELSRNRIEKQIMPCKTAVNWLFNDIWCYLVIGCFYWKICVFQQTVERALLYS